ncbi:hypothetical protein [Arthrobacter sp. ISL-28]|uniref:hypothetical protein n=1 Tax=Arthrobacter sp. ISL-28 TaxID=2819108 RepID=UPI001BECB1C3|nr:hypothetical protein [Arthrobacter sp. ISL-28]
MSCSGGVFAGGAAFGDAVVDPFAFYFQLYLRQGGHPGPTRAVWHVRRSIGTESATQWVARDNPRAQAFYRRNGFAASALEKILHGWEGMTVIQMVR